MDPKEVVAGPYTVWVAPTGTTFPNVDTAPAGDWTKLGTSGTLNYTEAGVSIEHNQTITEFRSAGGTGPRKAFRTEESFLVKFVLVDLSPAQYAKVLNDATVTTTAAGSGTPGTKKFPIMRGPTVAALALLARGISTVDPTLSAQYEVPIAYNNGQPKPAFVKGVPAGLECIWTALQDPTNDFGHLVIQTTIAS